MMINQIWACEENFLRDYLEAIAFTEISEEKFKAFFNFDDANEKLAVDVSDGIASFSIKGVLTKEGLPPIARILGFEGTSYNEIKRALNGISEDDSIKEVHIFFDTPGGDVNGVDETAQLIRAICGRKKAIAFNTGMIASAGYWLASQTNEIVSTAPSNQVGSIGIVVSQVDRSSSRFVNVVSKNAPLKRANVSTEKGLAELQRRADALERVFISRISEGRKISEEKVVSSFGKGGLLISKDPDEKMGDALSVKMIDGVKGINDVGTSEVNDSNGISAIVSDSGDNAFDGEDIQKLSVVEDTEREEKGDTSKKDSRIAVGNHNAKIEKQDKTKGVRAMSLKDLLKENPGLAAEIKQLKEEAYDCGCKAKQKEFEKISSYLASDKYPQEIKALALNVVKGELEIGSFIGAVAAFDTLKASAEKKEVIEKTKEEGETLAAKVPEVSQDGIIRNDADINAMIDETKKYMV